MRDSEETQDQAHLFRCAALKTDVDSLPDTPSIPEKKSIICWIARKKEQPALGNLKKSFEPEFDSVFFCFKQNAYILLEIYYYFMKNHKLIFSLTNQCR